MNILILTNNDSGLIQLRKELLEALVKKHQVVCCTPDENGYIDMIKQLGCGCVVFNFNRRGINPIEDLRIIRTYKKIIADTEADVVLTYTIKPNVYGGFACQQLGIPYLSNITGLGTTIENGGLLCKISLFMYKMGLRKSNCVFFQNAANQKFFVDKGIAKGVTRLLPGSGVNIDHHRLEGYPPDGKTFNFLFIGRLMKDKGIGELLTAIARLKQDGMNVFLDIVGGYDEDYSDLLKKYEADGVVKYHGQQENVHDYYAQAHCVVLPSYHEGMANVLLEAAATGRPVIASRVPGCMETFDEGSTGLGCEAKDVMSLQDAMKRMCKMSWETRRTMGLSGREKIVKEFSRQIIIDRYFEQIYLIEKNRNMTKK